MGTAPFPPGACLVCPGFSRPRGGKAATRGETSPGSTRRPPPLPRAPESARSAPGRGEESGGPRGGHAASGVQLCAPGVPCPRGCSARRAARGAEVLASAGRPERPGANWGGWGPEVTSDVSTSAVGKLPGCEPSEGRCHIGLRMLSVGVPVYVPENIKRFGGPQFIHPRPAPLFDWQLLFLLASLGFTQDTGISFPSYTNPNG